MTCPEDTTPRWRRRPAERPDEILKAALEVFSEQGLAGARVEDIAARAGVSKGTLYLYFSGKEEVFREAVRAKVQRTMEGLAAAAPPGEPLERLTRFIDAYFAYLSKPSFGRMYRLLLSELHQFPELSRFYAEEVSGHVMGLLREILAEGQEAGIIRRGETMVQGRMIVGVMVQHAVWISRRDIFPLLENRKDETLVNEIKDFLYAALLEPGVSPGSAR